MRFNGMFVQALTANPAVSDVLIICKWWPFFFENTSDKYAQLTLTEVRTALTTTGCLSLSEKPSFPKMWLARLRIQLQCCHTRAPDSRKAIEHGQQL